MPNLDNIDILQAMHGYNPYLADAFGISGDPGIMNGKIFYAQCEWFNFAFNAGYRDFVSVRRDLKCDSSASSVSYR